MPIKFNKGVCFIKKDYVSDRDNVIGAYTY